MLRHFYHSVSPGDIVVARKGRKTIAAFGTVGRRKAYYDSKKNLEAFEPEHVDIAYPNHLEVTWKDTPRFKSFDEIVFGMLAIYEIDHAEFRDLSGAPEPPPVNVEELSLTQVKMDDLIRSNRLQIGVVQTDSYRGVVRLRKGQDRIRELVLENYGLRCAVCDVSDPSLLVASHVVGWAEAPKHRGDLKNIICLCRAHDALFETGYWSLANNLRVVKKKGIASITIRRLLDGMCSFRVPADFHPTPRFVKLHRKKAGLDGADGTRHPDRCQKNDNEDRKLLPRRACRDTMSTPGDNLCRVRCTEQNRRY